MGDKHDRPGIYFTGFVCVKCGAAYPPDRDLLLCPACDNLLEAEYDYARLARDLDRDGLWRRRFGGDPATVGRSIEIEGNPWTVVGVMPPGALMPGAPTEDNELWLPMRMSPEEQASEINHSYAILGRLADGVTLAEARAEGVEQLLH